MEEGVTFHDVAQHVVDLHIHLLDVLELMAQAQALHLALEVGVLAARHLVAVDIGGGVLDARLKLAVAQAHVRPVVGEGLELFGGESGVPLLALEGGDHRVQGGWLVVEDMESMAQSTISTPASAAIR